MIILDNRNHKQLCLGLSLDEFKCKCGKCELTIINPLFLQAYEKMRAYLDKPLSILSGYRCPTHNANTPGHNIVSRHTIGSAVDIVWNDSFKSKDPQEIEVFGRLFGFDFIKTYPSRNFIHFEVNKNISINLLLRKID